ASLAGLALLAQAQKKGRPAPAETRPAATLAEARLQGYQQRQNLAQNSVVANLKFRNAGPTVMSGRVVDLAVCPTDPSHFVAAYATGGLWHTTNNGTTFTPLFEQQASYTLGAVAVRWQGTTPAAIWLGTGESNSSRSSYAGTGLYKSLDAGRTWQALGLPETHHIGRIVLHPTDPNVAWVAAVGHLYSPNPERGVYHTTDGGQTWRKVLYVTDKTGAIDLIIDPQNPQVLYAALWERHREAWNFVGSGLGSGIYKSTDGGSNWAKLNTPQSGFPATAGTGRIGLAVFPGNPNLIFATLDNQDNREATAPSNANETTPAPSAFRTMTAEALGKMPDEQLQAYFTRYGIPTKYTPQSVKADVAQGKYPVAALADFVNANDDLFNIEVKGAELYRSEDGGQTWRKTHEGYIDDLVYTYGYYFGQVRVAPHDPQRLYLLGVPAIKSTDGGKTWAALNSDNAHSDHHALWLNPQRPGHLLLGNDGGLNLSYDDGASWFKLNNLTWLPLTTFTVACKITACGPAPAPIATLPTGTTAASTLTKCSWAATGCRSRSMPVTTTQCTPGSNSVTISGSTRPRARPSPLRPGTRWAKPPTAGTGKPPSTSRGTTKTCFTWVRTGSTARWTAATTSKPSPPT
ncbi:MAG: hypothetical protein MUC97_18785, partial [Bernardetiaceae bacterium]|nr:hypothetical protein [Bernardetiaceae bacterium]